MAGARDHDTARVLMDQLDLVTAELRHAEAENDRKTIALQQMTAALQQIAYGEAGIWSRIAYAALRPTDNREEDQ